MEKQTLAEVASQKLLQMIQEKGYVPGDKLPTEVELSEVLEVGRNTVREALRILMSRNIVTIRQGSGTFLSDKNGVADDPLGFTMIEDRRKLTEDLIQVRVMLEPPIAALAAQNATEEDIRCLEQILLDLEEMIENREDYSEKDSQFHAQIANCSHNLVMANLVPVITDGVHIFAVSVRETEYEQTLLSHRRIFEAIRDRKPVEAQQAMNFHLMYNDNRYKEEGR
ncbi:FadR/GntR family transcriptional regulator [Lacrimispora indolis]|uniref:FadR/GntR family transcriptional regulator n=1 Tax=Lacrimispora indolis TaxID=69825 RepID=UPI00041BC68D|nr:MULTISPECIES: FadR/GntR family transcriptional regulator [Lachnospiraceae]MBE7721031.1 FadR family transcriptional regulator [Lacrimispora celerecrescens]